MLAPAEIEEVTPGGIYIPEQARPSLNQGTVLKVGTLTDPIFQPGTKVVFSLNSEFRIKIDGVTIIVLDAANVLLLAPLQVDKEEQEQRN